MAGVHPIRRPHRVFFMLSLKEAIASCLLPSSFSVIYSTPQRLDIHLFRFCFLCNQSSTIIPPPFSFCKYHHTRQQFISLIVYFILPFINISRLRGPIWHFKCQLSFLRSPVPSSPMLA
ncbi:hypothetical protein H2248_000678 [Termitomyces sp. 'cryptogamus']|nr:hypothetical protein H2248_000678 [Termitomyces sp. 'cryptogamus']